LASDRQINKLNGIVSFQTFFPGAKDIDVCKARGIQKAMLQMSHGFGADDDKRLASGSFIHSVPLAAIRVAACRFIRKLQPGLAS